MNEAKIIGAKTLMEKQYDGTKFIVEDLIPKANVILLAGAPKIGKSWFSIQLLLSICYGKETFLGHKVCYSGKALYLALEDTEPRIQERIIKQGFVPDSDKLEIAFSWPYNGKEISNLEDFLKKNPEVKIVCIDTLGRFSISRQDESYQSDYKWMSSIKKIANDFSATIILVTHLRKRPAEEDPYEQVSGSNGNSGAADTLIMIKRTRNQLKATLYSTSRDFIESEDDIYFDKDTCTWYVNSDNENLTPERKIILNAMKEIGKECKPSDIAQHTGKDPKNISHALKFMEQRGLVKHGTAYGTYLITGE